MNIKTFPIVVLGASSNPDRYSNQAVKLLLEYGYQVIPVHPKAQEIEGLPVVSALDELAEAIDTLTIYVSPALSTPLKNQIIRLNPVRVIFNPGTENPALNTALKNAGIRTETACTLILLKTKQF